VPLRVRVALWWGGLTGLVILAVGLLAYAADATALYTALDRELRETATRAAAAWRGPAPPPPAALAEAAVQRAAPDVVVQVYGPDGTWLAAAPAAARIPRVDPGALLAQPPEPPYDPIVRYLPPYVAVDPGAGAFATVTAPAGTRWRVYLVPVDRPGAAAGVTGGAAGAGYLLAAAPLHRIDVVIATTRRLAPLLAAAGGVALLGAGALLAGRLLRPVRTLTEAADAIARSRSLSRRVPARPGGDELDRLGATFNTMLDSLEHTARAEQRFVADASHELRAPLTVILANLELLERHTALTAPEREEALGEATREARRLVRLVADLLALARADAGATLRRHPVELDRAVLDAFGAARQMADGRDLTLGELEPVLVEGDPDQLKQLLLALLDNALKYTPPSGRVSLGLRRAGPVAEVTVRDTGIGIGAEDLPHVFERFYRADPARNRDPGGTGLGLAIARWIAEQHGGTLALSSEPGRGTTATVRLPLAS
jgi:signal transduction histidine kinase